MSDANPNSPRKAPKRNLSDPPNAGIIHAIEMIKQEETFEEELVDAPKVQITAEVSEQQINMEPTEIKEEVETEKTVICLEEDDPMLSQCDNSDANGSWRYVKQRKIERKPRKCDMMKPGMTAAERKVVFDRLHLINKTPFPHVMPKGGMAALPPPPQWSWQYETPTTRVKCRPYGFMPNFDGQTDNEKERTMKEWLNEEIEDKYSTTSSQTEPMIANDVSSRSCQTDQQTNKCDKAVQTESSID